MGDVVIIWMVRSVSSHDDNQHELQTLDSLDARLPTSTYSGARQGTEWKVRGISPRGSCWRPVWDQSAVKEWSRIHPPSSSDSGALDTCRTSPNTDPLHVGHCVYNVLARNQAREHRDRSWWSGAISLGALSIEAWFQGRVLGRFLIQWPERLHRTVTSIPLNSTWNGLGRRGELLSTSFPNNVFICTND